MGFCSFYDKMTGTHPITPPNMTTKGPPLQATKRLPQPEADKLLVGSME